MTKQTMASIKNAKPLARLPAGKNCSSSGVTESQTTGSVKVMNHQDQNNLTSMRVRCDDYSTHLTNQLLKIEKKPLERATRNLKLPQHHWSIR
jgi:hypothetical protein